MSTSRPLITLSKIKQSVTLTALYATHELAPAKTTPLFPRTLSGPSFPPPPSRSLNDRIAFLHGDITHLEIDAIVNAANKSLLGGGGVDGSIHRAAGPGLIRECATLHGCATGQSKITGAHRLHCQKIIHTVGPVYYGWREESEPLLEGCYTSSLRLAGENGCKSVAFPGISTGVYGYPHEEAVPIALDTTRRWLESHADLELVVFVTFTDRDEDASRKFLPMFFPPVIEDAITAKNVDAAEHTTINKDADVGDPEAKETKTEDKEDKEAQDEAKQNAEAEALAEKLPSVPTSEPVDEEPEKKKQKHDHA